MKPIAIFFHGLFFIGDPPTHLPNAGCIIANQIVQMIDSGLWETASEIHFGINGGEESKFPATNIIPHKATVTFHGLDSRNENLTLVMLEKWMPAHGGWNVLYLHAKGSTHSPDHEMSRRWRGCMMRNAVTNWRTCIADLESGHEAVGSHWMTGSQTPPGQSIFAGNFWWATSDFLKILPSIYERDRIKVSGIKSADSRYESEVWIGNGPRLPKIKDYHGPGWNPGQIGTCNP